MRGLRIEGESSEDFQAADLPAPKPVRQQIGEAGEGFPVRGRAGQTLLEAGVEDQVFPRGAWRIVTVDILRCE